jgi:hypothetical protein
MWALIIAAVANAAPRKQAIPLHVISVDNSYMAPIVRDRAVRRAIEYYKVYGARLSKRKLERRADSFLSIREKGNLFSFNQEFISWYLTLRDEGRIVKKVATHVLAPPFAINGERYMGGFAYLDTLWRGAFSYSTVQEYNSAGANRFRHSVVGIVHELGHSVFGCVHEAGANVMNASAYAEQQLIEGTGNLLPLGSICASKVKRFRY